MRHLRSYRRGTAARIALIAACACSAAAAAQDRTWSFNVALDGAPIGYHRFTLRPHDGPEGTLELVTEARFSVKVLGITAYRYAHDARERWRGGCLERLDSNTDDNGEQMRVAATPAGERLTGSGPQGQAALAGCVMTFAYWNPRILSQTRLLNAQTGDYEAVAVAQVGRETLEVGGERVPATRYRITGPKRPLDLWYSPQNEWLALESTVAGGRRLRYTLRRRRASRPSARISHASKDPS